MIPSRRQLEQPLSVRVCTHLAILNLLGFFCVFPLLSSPTMGDAQEPVAAAAAPQPIISFRISWTKSASITEKTRPLPMLYVIENGVKRHFTITEWASWKQRSGIWFQDNGLS